MDDNRDQGKVGGWSSPLRGKVGQGLERVPRSEKQTMGYTGGEASVDVRDS